jgi:hypothetical protein
MGTRSLTVFEEFNGEEIVVMYRQFDGYPSGHGEDLKDFLGGMKIVNGLSGGGRLANGPGCLAAQVVAHFKDEAGGFYLHPGGTRDVGEEYVYKVLPKESGIIRLQVLAGWGKPDDEMEVLFDGSIDDFDPSTVEESTAEE